MEKIKLQDIDLAVGEPLAYDVFDAHERLLLNRGHVIGSQEQLERLLERGAYGIRPEVEAVRRRKGGHPEDAAEQGRTVTVSVFTLVAEAQAALGTLLESPPAETSFTESIERVAASVRRCLDADTDAAIAAMFIQRDERYSLRHAFNSALVCELIGRQAGCSVEARTSLLCAALTMNIAMMKLQDTLYAHSGALSPEQKLDIVRHPEQGEHRLRALGVDDTEWLRAVREHHESNDGKGYPARLSADAISDAAKILALADQFCALVSERANRTGVLPSIALRKLFTERQPFDVTHAAILVREIGIYPPGTLVRLKNGDVALVVRRTRNANHPVVRALVAANRRTLDGAPKRLTSKPMFAIDEALARDKLGILQDRNGRVIALESLWDDASTTECDDSELGHAPQAAASATH